MTPEQGRLETNYLITRCVLKFLYRQNLISENQYQEHLKASARTYHSMITHSFDDMYEYFGGVTRILVPDNCKTAVIHNKDWYNQQVNAV